MACRIEWQPDLLFVISTSAQGREFAFPFVLDQGAASLGLDPPCSLLQTTDLHDCSQSGCRSLGDRILSH